MQIDYDQILAKRPHSEDAIFAWHQDMAYWPPFTSDISAATCWLALTDSTEENGCMRFVPGSHKEPQLRKHAPGQSLEPFACLALPCPSWPCSTLSCPASVSSGCQLCFAWPPSNTTPDLLKPDPILFSSPLLGDNGCKISCMS